MYFAFTTKFPDFHLELLNLKFSHIYFGRLDSETLDLEWAIRWTHYATHFRGIVPTNDEGIVYVGAGNNVNTEINAVNTTDQTLLASVSYT